MCRVVGSIGKHGCDTSGVAGDRVVALRVAADALCVAVLVHEFCRVHFLGLLYGLVVGARAHIRYTPEWVVSDDRLDERVERRDVRDRVRELANRTLHVGFLDIVCHVSIPPFCLFFSCVSGRPLTS
jgi:hypothetical protein